MDYSPSRNRVGVGLDVGGTCIGVRYRLDAYDKGIEGSDETLSSVCIGSTLVRDMPPPYIGLTVGRVLAK